MDHSKTSSTWGGGGGGRGGRGAESAALTSNAHYFFKIQQNAAKLCDLI